MRFCVHAYIQHLTPPLLSRRKPLFRQLRSLWLLEGWKWEGGGEDWEKRRGGGRGLQALAISWLSEKRPSACSADPSVCCLSPFNSALCSPVSQLRWWSALEWLVLMWESLLWNISLIISVRIFLSQLVQFAPLPIHAYICTCSEGPIADILSRHITVWQIPVSPWKPSITPFRCTLSISAARGCAPRQSSMAISLQTNTAAEMWVCSLKANELCKTSWQ